MDRNGYNPSLLDTESGECYVCKRCLDTARHEIFYGPNRSNSKKFGTWINLCPYCHTNIHTNPNKYVYLKKEAQRVFEKKYGHARFIAVFDRNYLEVEEWTE